MKKTIKHITIFLGLLLLSSGSPELFAQDGTTVNIVFRKDHIDVCGSGTSREVIISIDMGMVSYYDSLYGYDIGIRYDLEKIKFNSVLKINTISELCGEYLYFKTDTLKDGSGLVDVQGLTADLTNPLGGDKALVALYGEYIGDCPDETDLEIEYFDPVEGYNKEITEMNGVTIKAVIEDDKERYLNTAISLDTLKIDNEVGYGSVMIKPDYKDFNESKLESIEYELTLSKSANFEIAEVLPVLEGVNIINYTEIEKGYSLVAEFDSDIKDQYIFEVKLNQLDNETDYSQLTVTPVKVNDCACITRLNKDDVVLMSEEKDTVINVVDGLSPSGNIFAYYNSDEDSFIIDSDDIIRDIMIYDIQGYAVPAFINGLGSAMVRASTAYLSNGIYLVLARNIKNEINKIMLIKY